MRVVVLVDNVAIREDLIAEHGLSIWVEVGATRILFDTGRSGAFAVNAARLDVSLSTVDAVVLSHGHYDHSGGLLEAMDLAPRARVFLHPAALRSRYSQRVDGPAKSIGMCEEVRALVERRRDRVVWTRDPTPITAGVWVTGSIPRSTDAEDTGGPFFLDPGCRDPDDLSDDQALWIETPTGIVALLGCGHAGVVHTLRAIVSRTGSRSIRSVLGGLHLLRAPEDRLHYTASALRELDVRTIFPCHCTGGRALEFLRHQLPERVRDCGAGASLRFLESSPTGDGS